MKNRKRLPLVIGTVLVVVIAILVIDNLNKSEATTQKTPQTKVVIIQNEVTSTEATEYRASVSVEPVFPDSE